MPELTAERELPLRIIDHDGTPSIRCLCGTEAAVATGRGRVSADCSPAALIRMILHAKNCTRRR